jgi:ATP-dependent Clp protease ATP-binding subunit ClpA
VLRAKGLGLEEARAAVERIAGRGDEELWAELIPFAGRSKRALAGAVDQAGALGHGSVGTEHILLSLLWDDDGAGADVLASFGVDYEQVREAVVAARASPPRRSSGWLRRGDVQLALGVVAVFAAGVLVGRAIRAQ